MRRLLAAFALLAAAPLAAQAGAGTIDPGMTKQQVVAQLGAPASQRASGPLTFLFYPNECRKTCGTMDVVILENDGVVDAIFRSAKHQYTGQSSSPRALDPREAHQNASMKLVMPAPQAAPAAGAAERVTPPPAPPAAPPATPAPADSPRTDSAPAPVTRPDSTRH